MLHQIFAFFHNIRSNSGTNSHPQKNAALVKTDQKDNKRFVCSRHQVHPSVHQANYPTT